MIEWPNSSKLAQLLCNIEKKFAKHIGPEEFVQCSWNLIREQSNYDVPSSTSTSLPPPSSSSSVGHDLKKKTCNLENCLNRLRLVAVNELLQVHNFL